MKIDFTKLNQIGNSDIVQPVREEKPIAELTDEEKITIAVRIINNYHVNRKIAAGCKEQILKDIENGNDIYFTLCLAAEVIGRLEGTNDSFYVAVRDKIKKMKQNHIGKTSV